MTCTNNAGGSTSKRGGVGGSLVSVANTNPAATAKNTTGRPIFRDRFNHRFVRETFGVGLVSDVSVKLIDAATAYLLRRTVSNAELLSEADGARICVVSADRLVQKSLSDGFFLTTKQW